MGRAARDRGYEYLAICDHTPAVGAVQGLTPDDVRRQAQEIAAANEALAPFRVLRGIECDILPDGRLDLPDDVLAELDWVQASVHGGQRMPGPEMTRRVEEALRNPFVRCLSHPTGRLINRRPENAVDLERVYEVAREHGVAVEVNGLPDRLDLRGEHVRDALAAGVKIVCSTDAHGPERLAYMELAVRTARRGGATAAEISTRARWRAAGALALGPRRRSSSTATRSATRRSGTRSRSRSSTHCSLSSGTAAVVLTTRSRRRGSPRCCPDAEFLLVDELGLLRPARARACRATRRSSRWRCARSSAGDRATRSCPPTSRSRSPTACARAASA